MMQNSLDRLLLGMAGTLEDAVVPACADPYASAQATAAAELLRQLASRVTWDPTYLLTPAADVRAVLRETGGPEPAGGQVLGMSEPDEVPSETDELEQYATRHLDALAELAAGTWTETGSTDRERVVALVDAELDEELRHLRMPQTRKDP